MLQGFLLGLFRLVSLGPLLASLVLLGLLLASLGLSRALFGSLGVLLARSWLPLGLSWAGPGRLSASFGRLPGLTWPLLGVPFCGPLSVTMFGILFYSVRVYFRGSFFMFVHAILGVHFPTHFVQLFNHLLV